MAVSQRLQALEIHERPGDGMLVVSGVVGSFSSRSGTSAQGPWTFNTLTVVSPEGSNEVDLSDECVAKMRTAGKSFEDLVFLKPITLVCHFDSYVSKAGNKVTKVVADEIALDCTFNLNAALVPVPQSGKAA